MQARCCLCMSIRVLKSTKSEFLLPGRTGDTGGRGVKRFSHATVPSLKPHKTTLFPFVGKLACFVNNLIVVHDHVAFTQNQRVSHLSLFGSEWLTRRAALFLKYLEVPVPCLYHPVLREGQEQRLGQGERQRWQGWQQRPGLE